MDKTLWQLLKSTLVSTDGEGSAKRAASFYFTVVLLTSLLAIEEYCYYLSVISPLPTINQTIVTKSHEPIIGAVLLTLWIFFGFTSVDKLIDLIKFLKGFFYKDKKDTPAV